MASPTIGQQRMLQLLCRAAYVLRAAPSGSFPAVVYTITERGSGHPVQTLTERMVTSLVEAGWIELGQSQATYRVTPAGVAAANAPRGE